MAQNPCASEVWTVSTASFVFPAVVNPLTTYSTNVTNSPHSTLCQWAMGVLAGSDTSWFTATQNGQTGVNIRLSSNCPGDPPKSGTLLILALDPHSGATTIVATIPLSQSAVTHPLLSNLSPDGGQSYAQGSHQTITWSYTPSTDGLIDDTGTVYLMRNYLAIQLLGTVHLGTQTLAWTVPKDIFPTGFQYEIEILSQSTDPIRYPGCSFLTSVMSQTPFEIKAPSAAVSCPIATGTVGGFYSSALTAPGGLPPFTFSLASGSLPAGLILTPDTGAIAGTPTTAGTSNFTAQVVDTSGATGTASCSIVITRCDYRIAGPLDVPGLSRYTYEIQLPAGDVPTGVTWTADKPTVSVVPLGPPVGANPKQGLASFLNIKPDWIELRASFTLNGVQACAARHVALVMVTVGPPIFTAPGTPLGSEGGTYRFLATPPSPPAVPTWVTTFTPGSRFAKFVYNGGRQAREPEDEVDPGRHAFEAKTTVTLTSPPEQNDAQQRIQIGFIQSGFDAGSSNYSGGLHRTVTIPTKTSVDWLSANKDPNEPDSDLWPWYDESAQKTGTGTGSWTSVPPLEMGDRPREPFPAEYNPNDAADPDRHSKIITAFDTFAFQIHIAARTLDANLQADTHYFSEADSFWTTHFAWPVAAANVSIVSFGHGWKTPPNPTELEVNVVPTVTNHNIPFRRWNPGTCPAAICP